MATRSPSRRATRAAGKFDAAAYQRDAESFLGELGDAQFGALSGQVTEPDTAAIYQRHAPLFDQGSLDALNRAAEGDSEEARQARAMLAFATEGFVERRVAGLSDAIGSAESQAAIIWRGEQIPYRAAPGRAARLSNRTERNALMASYLEAVEAINPLRVERLVGMREALVGLGYADELEYAHKLNGIDMPSLAQDLRQFLLESETVYYAALRRNMAEIDIEQGDGSTADLAYILRGSAWDAWFGERQLMRVMTSTLAGLGVDLAGQSNVTLDFESRPGKSARAFCIPVRVPQDVRLGVLPHGGFDDYAATLHELGHVEHFAHADASLPVAWRYLGDNSVTEAYAMLLHYLPLEPGWVAEQLKMSDADAIAWADFFAFYKLTTLRRYVAKLLYEIRLHTDTGVDESRAYYAGLLGGIIGVRTPEELFLADVDDHFYAAILLRAWMLEGSLSAALRGSHGDTWWRSAEAGETLRRSWSRGQEWDAQRVVAHLGYNQLDWRPVLRQIRTRLIGEMSGYGGPNITTRAGTRKV
jgi:hypothetical protein